MNIEEEHQKILKENSAANKPILLPVFEPRDSICDSPEAAAFLLSDSDISFLSSIEDSDMLSNNREFLGGFLEFVKKARDMESVSASEGELRGGDIDGLSSGELSPDSRFVDVQIPSSNWGGEASRRSSGECDPSQMFRMN